MPPLSGISFRILHPPLGTPWGPPPSDPFYCVIESYRGSPTALLSSLRAIPLSSQPRLKKGRPWSLAFSVPASVLGSFSKVPGMVPELGRQMEQGLQGHRGQGPWDLGGKLQWGNRTLVMGILNATPDSFSDGGHHLDPLLAVDRALRMQEEGADWIDVGGESTRPGASPVGTKEEKKRILPVIKACSKVLKVPLSVDTYKSEVARAAVGEGAKMVNDIGALRLDPRMGKALGRLQVPVLLMHMKGKPRTMQRDPVYRDLMGDLLFFFRDRMAYAERCGIPRERILLDPGFGFGKTLAQNLELTDRLWELRVLGRPLAFGPSRKSTLGSLLGGAPSGERLEATLAAVTAGVLRGADLVRVHDVKETVKAVRIADALRYGIGALP